MTEQKTQKKFLMYIMDPYCGWCYGNSQIMSKLSNDYEIEFIPAGMWSGVNSRTGAEIKDFVTKGVGFVTKETGAQFSSMYLELLDKDNGEINFDSEIGSRAINTIKEIEGKYSPKVAQFTNMMFNEHYYNAKEQNLELFIEICEKLNIDIEQFTNEFNSDKQIHNTQTEFSRAYQLARRYPTLIAVSENGDIELVEGRYNYDKLKTNIDTILNE